jgi:hypothetical protein
MRLCACGCGDGGEALKYYDRHGVFKTYRKYLSGHAPHQVLTGPMLDALRRGREANWKNPEYVAKMKRTSSKTIRKTNARRAAGEFPKWDESQRNAMSIRATEQWRSGGQRKKMAIRADGLRSGLERHFADYLTANRIAWEYEPKSFPLIVDGAERNYAPDFYLPSLDWWIETKGFFWDADAKLRVELFAVQYPELNYSVLDRKLKAILGKQWDELPVSWIPYNSNNHVQSPLLNQHGNEIRVERISRRKTHCKRGHEFKEGSFRLLTGNRRDCRECSRFRWREKHQKMAA